MSVSNSDDINSDFVNAVDVNALAVPSSSLDGVYKFDTIIVDHQRHDQHGRHYELVDSTNVDFTQ